MPCPRTVLIRALIGLVFCLAVADTSDARLVRLEIERREVVLDGRPFGLAGPYEKLVGTAHFALDPD